MKSKSKIVQWVLAAVFALCAIGNGFHFSSILLLLAAALMAPIPAVRNLLGKLKIKNAVAIALAAVLFLGGIIASPTAETSEEETEETTESEKTEEDTSEKETEAETETEETEAETERETSKETEKETEKESGTSSPSVGDGTATAVDPAKLPAYSGTPYTVVNNNVPNFSSAELTVKSYEKYAPLDSKGRCGVAVASIGEDLMPTEERDSIGSVKPTGWHTVKYDNVDGKYLYNRCHLIGFQLTGENANEKNLITGTRYLNVDGMLPFENMVADYIKETGNHVAYRVTPIFVGNNLVASGVQMEAYSVEDDGDGICFNVYCYNVQPDIVINYADGSSYYNEPVSTETESVSTVKYVLNTNSEKFHYPDCKSVEKISAENYEESDLTRDELIAMGYDPCENCDP